MGKLVLELQRDAMTEECSVSVLLRKAMVVAKKLRIADFEKWVSFELHGFPPGTVIPKYREVVGSVKAWNPYNGWIPILIEDEKLANAYSRRMIGQSVGSMEGLVGGGEGRVLQVPFSPALENRIMKGMDMPFKPTLHVGSNQIEGILQAVRNTVLNWALDLESRGILGDDMSFTQKEKQAASDLMQTVNIENFQGILGDVSQSTVTQTLSMNVRKGDFESLSAYLRSIGISAADVKNLKAKLDHDPQPESKGTLGPQVSAWVGKMVGKAASGVWQLAVGTAGSLLAQSIWLYYGFS